MLGYLIVVGYSAKQLTANVNEKIVNGYSPIGSHQIIFIEDGELWEYSQAMELPNNGSS